MIDKETERALKTAARKEKNEKNKEMSGFPQFYELRGIRTGDVGEAGGRVLMRLKDADGRARAFFFAPAFCTSAEVLGTPPETTIAGLKNYLRWVENSIFESLPTLDERNAFWEMLNGA